MERAKEIAIQCLESLGCDVTDIPETNDKRADLLATCNGAKYFIEVKQRLEDPDVRESHLEQMITGKVVNTTESHSYSNRIDGILRHGLKQITETPKGDNAFNLIWFYADGIDADLKVRRARNTFYGLVPLIPLEEGNQETINCFYFDFSTSYRMPSVQGMVTVDGKGLQLCINEFADRIDFFRQSYLVQRLDNAVIDPVALVAQGEAIAFRSSISRKEEKAVLEELERTTNRKFVPIRIKRHASSVFVPRTDTI